MRLVVRCGVLVFAALSAVRADAGPGAELEGCYVRKHYISIRNGEFQERLLVADTMKVSAEADGTIRVRIDTKEHNDSSCGVGEKAKLVRAGKESVLELVPIQDPETIGTEKAERCEVKVRVTGSKLVVQASDEICGPILGCGYRGVLNDIEFRRASRRPVNSAECGSDL